MKKIVTTACGVLLANMLVAQSTFEIKNLDNNTTLVPNGEIYLTTTENYLVKTNFDIVNTSTTTTHQYLAKRYDITLNEGASAFYCFAGTCYGEDTFLSPESLTLTPGQSASQIPGLFNNLQADLQEGPNVGVSVIKYTFYNASDLGDSLQVTMKYNSTPTGMSQKAKIFSSFEIFPNPANGISAVHINSPLTTESSLNVFNSLGQSVYQKNVLITEGKNKVDLHLENVPSGVYFVSIKSGLTTLSKKLIVN